MCCSMSTPHSHLPNQGDDATTSEEEREVELMLQEDEWSGRGDRVLGASVSMVSVAMRLMTTRSEWCGTSSPFTAYTY